MELHTLHVLLSAASLCSLALLAADVDDFWKAVQRGDLARVGEYIRQQPALVDARDPSGASAVLFAVYRRHPEIADVLVSQGAHIGFPEACALGKYERVKQLASADPSVMNTFSADGFTPLSLAVFFGHHDVAIFLLARHADPNIVSNNSIRITPLHSAVERGDLGMVEMLLSHGANPNGAEFLGATPLHSAAAGGADAIVRVLLTHGASLTAKTNDGKTAEQLASEYKHPELAAWLKQQAASR